MDLTINPPESAKSEQALIGSLIASPDALEDVASRLTKDDFFYERHRIIFGRMLDMRSANKPIDLIALSDKLSGFGMDLQYLNELAINAPSAANILSYVRIIREKSAQRRMVELAASLCRAAQEPGRDVKSLLAEAEKGFADISNDHSKNESAFKRVGELFGTVIADAAERTLGPDGNSKTSVKTFYPNLDGVLTGLHRGDLVIVAGRPSMGKTTFAINIAENVAFNSELPVAVFSMEMSDEQIATRIICSRARVDAQDIRQGRINEYQWQRIFETQNRLHDKPLYINDTPSLTVSALAGHARQLSRQTGGLGLIVIDYIQLMRGTNTENRSTELSEISRGLKALARELDCPVVCLSQLNRGVENRMNKRPMMSDLRESGAIEQDADVIMFIYRESVYDDDADKNLAEVIIGKQRNGPIGTVRMGFKGGLTRFECPVTDDSFRPV